MPNITKLPGMMTGAGVGIGTAIATADNKEDAFIRGIMFGLGGGIYGSKQKWTQEFGEGVKNLAKRKDIFPKVENAVTTGLVKAIQHETGRHPKEIWQGAKETAAALGKALSKHQGVFKSLS